MNKLTDFPTIYAASNPPTGEAWLAKFDAMKQKAEIGGIILFYGASGTGKTRMAYEVAANGQFPDMTKRKVNHSEQRPIIYRTAMEFFMELRSTYRTDSPESEFELFRWYQDAALMVVDEIQERGETAFEDQKLTAMIDGRYRNGRPTILIANLTKDQFAKSVSPSIASRMVERGGAVNFDWKSYRQSNQ